MTLDELTEALSLAPERERLLGLARNVEAEGAGTDTLFGVHLDLDLEDALRMALAGEFRRRAAVAEARLREIGVLFPENPAPGAIDPGPAHASLRPASWDPKTDSFEIWVPCTTATSYRAGLVPGSDHAVAVDEALSPHGLEQDNLATVTVEDATDPHANWDRCGLVVGCSATDHGVAIRVRLDAYMGLVRGAVASGRIAAVGIGYQVLEEERVEQPGERPLVLAHRWRLHEIRLHRLPALAEAA
ncbi:hypothetical protein OKC48_07500 [Methylorubrum extorquens]|uniref:hypothetical protein n=1 Tax=Methylorubrum extorquens TaxID=408 RepID=UPI002237DCAC|nr:hypothetical protein [Methylorubrum extorquens]UYW28351.1 hypothetical protein OKC48_07500 [Methylorubrum extorquens]